MIILRGTESLVVTQSAAESHDYHVSMDVLSAGKEATPDATSLNIAVSTADQTVVAAPTVSDQKKVIKSIFVRNRTANTTTLTFKTLVSGGTARVISPAISLASGQALFYSEATGWKVYDSDGTVTA